MGKNKIVHYEVRREAIPGVRPAYILFFYWRFRLPSLAIELPMKILRKMLLI